MKISTKRSKEQHFSPLRYPGGKSFLSSYLSGIIDKQNLRSVTYIEPYAGGAGAALALLFSNKVNHIIINDLDSAIYSFWQSAVSESDRFIEAIRKTPVTVGQWRKQRKIYDDPKSCQFALGFATFFLNRTNVSGNLDGGPIGGFAQNGNWKIDARYYKQTLIKRIQTISKYKDQITIQNRDGLDLIEDYLNQSNTLIYLDPPYYEKGATLYLNHFNQGDHERLASRLNRNPEANWVLTYDNKPEIRMLYPDRRIFSYSLRYNAYESRKGKEVLILSDQLTP
jgi:DNA adenine methylase